MAPALPEPERSRPPNDRARPSRRAFLPRPSAPTQPSRPMRPFPYSVRLLAAALGVFFTCMIARGSDAIAPASAVAGIDALKRDLLPAVPRELVVQHRRILDDWPEATPDLFRTIGAKSESHFSAIAAFAGERFSIRFREDSDERFACDEWWDGRNYFVRKKGGRSVSVYEDGNKPASLPVAFLSTSSDMGRSLFEIYLDGVATKALVVEQGMDAQGHFEIRNSAGGALTADFLRLKEGLLIKRFSCWTNGSESCRYVNLLEGEPKTLEELEAAYRGVARYTDGGKHKILDVFEIRFLSFGRPLSDEALGPQVELGTLVIDNRVGRGFDKTPNYGWNGALIPKEEASKLVLLPGGENDEAISNYEKALAAKIARTPRRR